MQVSDNQVQAGPHAHAPDPAVPGGDDPGVAVSSGKGVDKGSATQQQHHQPGQLGSDADMGFFGGISDDDSAAAAAPTLLDPSQATAPASFAEIAANRTITVPAANTPEPEPDNFVKGLSHVRRKVSNMKENFEFFKHAVDEVCSDGEPIRSSFRDGFKLTDSDFLDPVELQAGISNLSISTSYSGVGAPEVCAHLLKNEVESKLGHKISSPEIYFQMEYDEACRSELSLLDKVTDPEQSTCLFGDLCDFYVDSLQDVVKHLMQKPDLALEILAKMITTGEAVKSSAYCYKHKKVCELSLFSIQVLDDLMIVLSHTV